MELFRHGLDRVEAVWRRLILLKVWMMYLLMTNVSPEDWRACVRTQAQVIGRLPDCDIVIPGQFVHVSRRHASIGARQNEFSIQDLGSSGGTRLNDVPIRPDSEVCAVIGDRLSLADLELYLVSAGAEIIQEALKKAAASTATASEPTGTTGLNLGGGRPNNSIQEARLRDLSPAELEVARWICRGQTTIDQIGRMLFRSPHTVKTQLNSIYRKLKVHSRDELLSYFRFCENAWTRSKPFNDRNLADVRDAAGNANFNITSTGTV